MPAARRFIVEQRLNELIAGPARRSGRDRAGRPPQLRWSARCSSSAWPTRFGESDAVGAGAQRHLPAGTRTDRGTSASASARCSWSRKASPSSSNSTSSLRCAGTTSTRRSTARTCCRWRANTRSKSSPRGVAAFVARHAAGAVARGRARMAGAKRSAPRPRSPSALAQPLPARPPQFCIGCPERPVFSALKLAQQDIGPVHVAGDIGCHAFATFEPFSMGHSILGYGMSLASRAGVSPMMQRRTLAVMGDGGFWHNGLLTGVQSALFNGGDSVLVILKNGYTSATGTQDIISSRRTTLKDAVADKRESVVDRNQTIERTLEGIGVQVDAHGEQLSRRPRCAAPSTRRSRRTSPGSRSSSPKASASSSGSAGSGRGAPACWRRASACARQVRRRRGHVFRRPFVHPPLGLPDVDAEAEQRPAQGRPGRDGHRRLRRLRAVRRERARGDIVPSFYRGEVIQNPHLWDRVGAAVRHALIRLMQPA